MASLLGWLCGISGAVVTGIMGWRLGGLLDHPLLGLAGGALAVIGHVMDWGGHWRLDDGTAWPPRPEDSSPWSSLYVPPVLLVVMAMMGAFGAGVGWLVGAVWQQPLTGQTWGMIALALTAWLVMMSDQALLLHPGKHGDVHGDARAATLAETRERGVQVNTSTGVHLGYGIREESP